MTPEEAYRMGRAEGMRDALDQLMVPEQRQDVPDGASIRRLAQVLPKEKYEWDDPYIIISPRRDGMFTVAMGEVGGPYEPDPWRHESSATTIAEAADKCRSRLTGEDP